jgi:hypothetical protein
VRKRNVSRSHRDPARRRVVGGPLGTFRFDRNGDPTSTPFSVYRFPPSRPTHPPPYVLTPGNGGVFDRVNQTQPKLAEPVP